MSEQKDIKQVIREEYIRVNVRECKLCGDRQYYSLPDKNDLRIWKPCPFKKTDKITLNQIK
jgi:hypothetical protein